MTLEDLYELIPDFPCLPGCTECCRVSAPPSRTSRENTRLIEYVQRQGVRPAPRQEGCPYRSDDGCVVHPVRPFICRLYGTSPNYPCRMGIRPVRLLHEDEEADLFHFYYTHFTP